MEGNLPRTPKDRVASENGLKMLVIIVERGSRSEIMFEGSLRNRPDSHNRLDFDDNRWDPDETNSEFMISTCETRF